MFAQFTFGRIRFGTGFMAPHFLAFANEDSKLCRVDDGIGDF